MFSKSRSKQNDAETGSGGTTPTIISSDMRISGDLRTDGDVQVDGVVDGDIESNSLSIGKSAEVNGEIVAEVVRIWGRVNGRVRGRDVTLMETAEVNGDIVHETLEVARGAFLEGMVKRLAREETAKPKVNLVVAGADAGNASGG